ncbi:MAG TPA: hypothetical protein PKY59_05615 [Pyrinomonadaceae bacterium]|nr:hypothetical protein [Pyrinomonadaceae bacterium]
MLRDHTNYFGQLSTAFIILSEFELEVSKSLKVVFDGWQSVESFDAGDEPIANLKRVFILQGNDFNDFFNEHRDVFQNVSTAALTIIGVTDKEYDLDYLNLQTSKFVLALSATKRVTKDDVIRRVKTAPEYHEIIAQNLELISQTVMLAWEYGKEHDQFLNSLTDLNQLNIKR